MSGYMHRMAYTVHYSRKSKLFVSRFNSHCSTFIDFLIEWDASETMLIISFCASKWFYVNGLGLGLKLWDTCVHVNQLHLIVCRAKRYMTIMQTRLHCMLHTHDASVAIYTRAGYKLHICYLYAHLYTIHCIHRWKSYQTYGHGIVYSLHDECILFARL